MRIITRTASQEVVTRLERQGVASVLAPLYAARGIANASDIGGGLGDLIPPAALRGTDSAARLLADAITAGKRLCVIADYDCDGATACAVMVRTLRAMGAAVDYLVPHRRRDGYGLTPEVADQAARHPRLGQPDLLITVDNGIASVDGVARAKQLGMAVLITDHHLPGRQLPDAACIVNPNQPGCDFPSKCIAGAGVAFYVMLALRAELRSRGGFGERAEPNLAQLLDLVALGTVADVVTLDRNNRILVAQGLARIRAGKTQPGIQALFTAAGRDARRASPFDLGFLVGPRLNAAGRLDDMALGIECLLSDDPGHALALARQLDQLNRERREIEAGMVETAQQLLNNLPDCSAPGIALTQPDWHEGVVGILASRIKERQHRPVFAFAPSANGLLKGSGRSIAGLHLRDCLDRIDKAAPGLILRFGGHAMAAGATIAATRFAEFAALFSATCEALIDPAALSRIIETDGPLPRSRFSLHTAHLLEEAVWGQGFAAPCFSDTYRVLAQRILKDRHLKLTLDVDGERQEAMHFNFLDTPGPRIQAAWRLGINEWRGVERPQMLIDHWLPA